MKLENWIQKHKNLSVGIGVVFVIFVALVLLATPTPTEEKKTKAKDAKQTKQENKEEKPEDYNFDIRFSNTAVQMTSKESEVLNNCTVEVNSHSLSSGWTMHASFDPNTPVILNLSDFAKNDGERFNPYQYKLENVSIKRCEGQGTRFGYYEAT